MPFQHVALKITASNPDYGDIVVHELDINKRLTKDPSLGGFAFVARAAHLCLVFQAIREPLGLFQHRLVGDRILTQLLKVYVDFILQGLEYLHPDCQVIHTGLFFRYF